MFAWKIWLQQHQWDSNTNKPEYVSGLISLIGSSRFKDGWQDQRWWDEQVTDMTRAFITWGMIQALYNRGKPGQKSLSNL